MHPTTHTFQEYSVVCTVLYCYRDEGASCQGSSSFGTQLPLRRAATDNFNMVDDNAEV